MSFSFIRTRLEPFVTTYNHTRTRLGQYASIQWVLFLQMPFQLPHFSTILEFSLMHTWPWQNTISCHKSGLVRNHGLPAIHPGMKTANLPLLKPTIPSPIACHRPCTRLPGSCTLLNHMCISLNTLDSSNSNSDLTRLLYTHLNDPSHHPLP